MTDRKPLPIRRYGLAAALLALVAPVNAAETRLAFTAGEGTWMAPDISPDGHTILFDLLGDIYAIDSEGGAARPLLTGPAFESQPVFSPDGKRIAFLSDRSGATNLWVADADGGNARQLSQDSMPAIYTSPGWSADGRSVTVSRTIHSILAFELFRYDVASGAGTKVTSARPSGSETHENRINALGAVASPDGRYLYYARKAGALFSEKPFPHWELVRREIASGTEDRIIASPGAAMRPALSHDGTKLVYASRRGAETGLRLRDLASGADRWLTFPIDPDSQQGGYYTDLVPRVTFLPGDRAVLTAIGGKLTRIDLADGKRVPIPFTADVNLAVRPNDRVAIPDETGPVRVRVIQSPRLSPDGRQIAFGALGKLYVQDRAGRAPRAVAGVTGMAWQPAWTPDGRTIAYVTWSPVEGGAVWTVPARGGRPRRLTSDGAYYHEPTVSPDGRTIAVLRGSQTERIEAGSDLSPDRPTDIVALPISGGAARVVTAASGARALEFDAGGTRLRMLLPSGMESVALADGGRRQEFGIVVPNPNRYFDHGVPPQDARLSPDGRRLLVKAASQAWLLDTPAAPDGTPPRIDLANPPAGAVRLTDIGADYLGWSPDGGTILWSVGSTLRMLPAVTAGLTRGAGETHAARIEAAVSLPRDLPRGVQVLRGGTAITMRGDEVIAHADIVLSGGRIAAIGPAGSVAIPAGATVHDITGRYVVPGFVDTHAHWFDLKREILDFAPPSLFANLAYGVTSGLDVQTFTVDTFGYQDAIDAGLMVGPRAFSTGPGIFINSDIDSSAAARAVLSRYRDHYRTRNIKSYLVGNRTQRRYLVAAAAELGMNATTEGASDLVLGLTHVIDGFAGNEHNLPVAPLGEDVVTLLARTRIGYTPTLALLYGGPSALHNSVIAGGVGEDAKLAHFLPPGEIEGRQRGQAWTPPIDLRHPAFAADVMRVRRAGGLIGIGSHGTIQGLGYHYELDALATGGATAHEVLRAATLDGAEVIGRAALIGSLEPGKYADMLVLDRNPLDDIRNARRIALVVKNGRAYDPATLDEAWPRQRKLAPLWFSKDMPTPAR